MYFLAATATVRPHSQRLHWRAPLAVALAFACGCGESSATNASTTVDPLRQELSYASWTASSQDGLELIPFPGAMEPELQVLDNETIRQVVRLSAGGESLRVRLSNAYGPEPIHFDLAGVALSLGGSEIDEGSHQLLTFGGQTSVTIEVGDEIWSDYAALATEDHAELAISLFSEQPTGMGTTHSLGRQTAFLTQGQAVSAPLVNPSAQDPTSYFWLNAVEVSGQAEHHVVVAFGDSITDGFNSTLNENRRYPNYLSNLLAAADNAPAMSVVNAGISGNRVLTEGIGPAGLSRFDHDVLEVPGVDEVVILLGINDIGLGGLIEDQAVTAEEITGGIETMVDRANREGVEVHLGTLLPFQGTFEPYYSDEAEAKRQAVNRWIRSNGEVAGVIDFDQLMADPLNPQAMLPSYDSGDSLHPNDEGYEAMAEEVARALQP